jgi:hypothetical protein
MPLDLAFLSQKGAVSSTELKPGIDKKLFQSDHFSRISPMPFVSNFLLDAKQAKHGCRIVHLASSACKREKVTSGPARTHRFPRPVFTPR